MCINTWIRRSQTKRSHLHHAHWVSHLLQVLHNAHICFGVNSMPEVGDYRTGGQATCMYAWRTLVSDYFANYVAPDHERSPFYVSTWRSGFIKFPTLTWKALYSAMGAAMREWHGSMTWHKHVPVVNWPILMDCRTWEEEVWAIWFILLNVYNVFTFSWLSKLLEIKYTFTRNLLEAN